MPNASLKLNDVEVFNENNQTVTAKNLTVDTTVKGTSKIDGTLAFFGGFTADNRSFTLDGVSKYHIFAWVRYDASPYYPMVMALVLDSSDGTVTKQTLNWGNGNVNHTYNATTKVLEVAPSTKVKPLQRAASISVSHPRSIRG